LSVLGKYRREADREEDEKPEPTSKGRESQRGSVDREREETPRQTETVPNRDRKSPIVSFSIPTDLRACLQAIRKNRAINLSMWVEKQLREAILEEFPSIAEKYLES
jgi:hypothetical protein